MIQPLFMSAIPCRHSAPIVIIIAETFLWNNVVRLGLKRFSHVKMMFTKMPVKIVVKIMHIQTDELNGRNSSSPNKFILLVVRKKNSELKH